MVESTVAPDDRFAVGKLADVRVSPDGTRVAAMVLEWDPEVGQHSSIGVARAGDPAGLHRVTRSARAWRPRWSPDGAKLAFLSDRDADAVRRVAGDRDLHGGSPQVWVCDLDRGGEPRQVTSVPGGVREYDWGPDGDRLVVVAAGRERDDDDPVVVTRLQHKFLGRGWLDDDPTYLYVAPVAGGSATRLDDAQPRGARLLEFGVNPAWSPRGDRIAFLSNTTDQPDNSFALDVHTVAPDGSDHRVLTGGDVTAVSLAWHPDGDALAFAATDPENWYAPTTVRVADPDAGDVRDASPGFDRSLSPYDSTLAWRDDGAVLAPVGDRGQTKLAAFDAAGDAPPAIYDLADAHCTIEDFHAAGGTAGMVLSAPDRPHELYTHPSSALGDDPVGPDASRRASDLNAGVVAADARPGSHWVTFENGDGDDVHALVRTPPDFDPAGDPRPTVLDVHGGPCTYDPPEFDFDAYYWTSRGYVTLHVNYRGSTSYGRAFSECVRGDWGPRETDDLLAGVDHLVERGWTDPDRVFATGFSQGAVNVLYLLARTDRFAAAAAHHGVYDLYSAYGTTDLRLWYEQDLGTPWDAPDGYRRVSGITDVDQVETPTLVTAGGRDWRCPPTQSEQLYVSLKRLGVPTELVVYRDQHHSPGEGDHGVDRLEREAAWFDRFDPAT